MAGGQANGASGLGGAGGPSGPSGASDPAGGTATCRLTVTLFQKVVVCSVLSLTVAAVLYPPVSYLRDPESWLSLWDALFASALIGTVLPYLVFLACAAFARRASLELDRSGFTVHYSPMFVRPVRVPWSDVGFVWVDREPRGFRHRIPVVGNYGPRYMYRWKGPGRFLTVPPVARPVAVVVLHAPRGAEEARPFVGRLVGAVAVFGPPRREVLGLLLAVEERDVFEEVASRWVEVRPPTEEDIRRFEATIGTTWLEVRRRIDRWLLGGAGLVAVGAVIDAEFRLKVLPYALRLAPLVLVILISARRRRRTK